MEVAPATAQNAECDRPLCPQDSGSSVQPPADSSIYGDTGLFQYIKYAFPPDPVTGGAASWELWLSKELRSATRFAYATSPDCGCYDRHGAFTADKDYKHFSQTKGAAYPRYCLGPTREWAPWSMVGLNIREQKAQCKESESFDRGHLVPANHLDHNKAAIKASNKMTNILPQVSIMNRQGWLGTEEIIECCRDIVQLHVVGGAVFDETQLKKGILGFNGHGLGKNGWKGDEKLKGRRQWFWDTHRAASPTYMWKIIHPAAQNSKGLDTIAFWMPNTDVATRSMLPEFVVSISQLEKLLALHGQVTGKVHVRETFAWLTNRDKPGNLDTWLDNVNGHCTAR